MRARFFFTAHPARAILEAWPLGLAILYLLHLQVGIASSFVLTNGLFFLCATCGLWVVLRARLPRGGWWRQALVEMVTGLALGLGLAAGIRLPAHYLGWEGVWLQSSSANPALVTLLLACTGLGYLLARVGLRFWRLWDRLRKQRMVWALTHAHLTLVVLLACVFVLLFFFLTPYSNVETFVQPTPAGLLTSLTERLLHTVFPALTVLLFMTLLALAVLLPPSLLFSFWIARRTTRRLETLAAAARALRYGRYETRVAVVGQDEVAQLQADFNAMAGDLGQAMGDLQQERDRVAALLRARRELVAGVSHELRTPVATIRALLESATEGEAEQPSDPLRHDLEVAQGEVLRLQRLIDDLFALSQAEVGGLAVECQPTDLRPVVRRMVDAFAGLAWNAGRIELLAELPETLPPALADAARLEQVLANLLRNAIRHTPPGGIVAVAAREEAEMVRLDVRDTGQGIDSADLPRIWERFYRGASAAGGGAGLGLALVKELAEAMGGRVAVESAAGQGSCFTVWLPRA